MASSSASPNSQRILRLHLDTEFTDFAKPDLISIGLAASSELTFYAENLDFDRGLSSAWVVQNIYPLLDHAKHGMKRSTMVARLWEWLDNLDADKFVIMVDYPTDWLLFKQHGLAEHPKFSHVEFIFDNIAKFARQALAEGMAIDEVVAVYNRGVATFQKALEDYFSDPSIVRHNALHDAIGNMKAYSKLTIDYGI